MNSALNILALHGFTGCGEDFKALAQTCGGQWHCPDLPGHKSQSTRACSPAATLHDLQETAAALPRPKVLLGYSMGARAALQLALAQPEAWQALILISGNPGIECEQQRSQRAQADAELAEQIERDGLTAFLSDWQNQPLIRSQANIPAPVRDALLANRQQHSAHGLARSLRQFGQGSCPNLWPQLKDIRIPMLCLTGAADSKYHQIAQRITTAAPQAQHISIPAAGHMPQLEALEPSARAIRDFLKIQS